MSMRTAKAVLTAAFVFLMSTALAEKFEEADDTRQFTYSWPYTRGDAMQPRGGTSQGPAVELDDEVSAAWRALREPGIPALERDRRAILAMAGGFRTSFDFIETVGFVDDFTPDRPYQSWGTEYVYVVTDEPTFISLQHIIVMFFETDDGEIAGPAVVKHWRQDWQYEDRELHVYVGHNKWERRKLSRREVRGTWSQAVYQVDDSPRYQAIGKWEHHGNYSSWSSSKTWRPLPRREFSVRDDYHVLSGTNRHTITPTGWVQEEDNLKLVLNEDSSPRAEQPYLAREAGLNRYERIVGHDFSAGDKYWENTSAFWADVRGAWEDTFEERRSFGIRTNVDDRRLFEVMFEYAAKLDNGESYDPYAGREFIAGTLERFLN